jgi:hypothetical protein
MNWPYPPAVILFFVLALICICFGLFTKSDTLKEIKYSDGTHASPVALRILLIVSGLAGIVMLMMNRSSK